MGMGFLTPRTIVDQLKLKFLVGHHRIEAPISELLYNLQLISGFSRHIAKIPTLYMYWHPTWIHDAYDALQAREMTLENNICTFSKLSKNLTVMDYARHFTNSQSNLRMINTCRRYKKIVYPFELVRLTGRNRSNSFIDRRTKNSIRWEFLQNVTYPANTAWIIWEKFICWLPHQNINYIHNLQLQIRSTYRVNKDRTMIAKRINDSEKFQIYEQYRNKNEYYITENVNIKIGKKLGGLSGAKHERPKIYSM